MVHKNKTILLEKCKTKKIEQKKYFSVKFLLRKQKEK